MSDRSNMQLDRMRWHDDGEVPKFFGGSSNQEDSFDEQAWYKELRQAEEKQGRIIRSNKEPLKNGSGQRFLYAKYGQDWEIELRLLTDNYFDALRRLGYRISFDEAKDHLVWGIDAYLLRVLKGQGTDVRLKEIERCYKGIIGSQIYS